MDDDLLPGFRFYPTEEELVSFYLYHKLKGTRSDLHTVIPLVNIYDYNPWELPQLAGEVCGGDREQWFFFSGGQERDGSGGGSGGGGRPNRLTREGYWKATGSPARVYSSENSCVIGRKRTMVFYLGRAPNGIKTSWKMNEYKPIIHSDLLSSTSSAIPIPTQLSLCRIYKKSRCLRAFDRRPPSEAAAGQLDDAAIHNNPIVGVGERSESSWSAANNDPSHEYSSTTGVATEPSWDSDQLMNWYMDG